MRLHVLFQLGVKVAVMVGHLAIFQERKCVQKGQAIEPDQVKKNSSVKVQTIKLRAKDHMTMLGELPAPAVCRLPVRHGGDGALLCLQVKTTRAIAV
jgi:hypothetical protein